MKKRIKLTDKELAIGMWVYICLYIESFNTEDVDEDYELIVRLKQNWLLAHNVKSYRIHVNYKWSNDCYFCEKYYDTCHNCPLQSCKTGSLYDSVTEYYRNKDKQSEALESAKKILNVILAEKEVNR